jgi:hypothetical protein
VGRPEAAGLSMPLLSALLCVDVEVVVALAAMPPDDDLNPFLLGRHFLRLTMLCLLALPPATRCLMFCWILVVDPFASRTVYIRKRQQRNKTQKILNKIKYILFGLKRYRFRLIKCSHVDSGLSGGCDNPPPIPDIVSIYKCHMCISGCTLRALTFAYVTKQPE